MYNKGGIIIDEGYEVNGVRIYTKYHYVDDDVIEKIRDMLEEYYSEKIDQYFADDAELNRRNIWK